jgi:hypothetical protein
MTTGQPVQQRPSRLREDHKVQKLMQRVEKQLALQAKAAREGNQDISKN